MTHHRPIASICAREETTETIIETKHKNITSIIEYAPTARRRVQLCVVMTTTRGAAANGCCDCLHLRRRRQLRRRHATLTVDGPGGSGGRERSTYRGRER